MKFRNDTEVKEAFDEAFDAEGVATAEKVDAAIEAVKASAAEQFGSEGLYVSGLLNSDMQCVSFQFKRPGIGQRVQHTISCEVERPPRKDEEQVVPGMDTKEARKALLEAVADELDSEGFNQDGTPDVKALNAALAEGVEPFTAAERDELWDK